MSTAEIDVMRRFQHLAARGPVPGLARAYSAWGEHAAGWIALGVVGTWVDRPRRDVWMATATGAFAAHATAVALKRVVRRHRPADPGLRVLVPTPSDLSFPSAHAASTTAATMALSTVVGPPPAMAAAAAMAVARVLLGVHYPSDVAAGALIGAVAGCLTRRTISARMAR